MLFFKLVETRIHLLPKLIFLLKTPKIL